jgi:hypothetical protein
MNFLSKLASFIAIFGLVAVVAGLINRVPRVLQWIDMWGTTTSWLIKIALVAGGGLLWFISRPRAGNDMEAEG